MDERSGFRSAESYLREVAEAEERLLSGLTREVISAFKGEANRGYKGRRGKPKVPATPLSQNPNPLFNNEGNK